MSYSQWPLLPPPLFLPPPLLLIGSPECQESKPYISTKYCHAFSSMVNCILKHEAKINPLPLLLLPDMYLVVEMRKKTYPDNKLIFPITNFIYVMLEKHLCSKALGLTPCCYQYTVVRPFIL